MKEWVTRNNLKKGGQKFTKASLWYLLQNPLYVGKITHRKKTLPGEHEGIISEETFEKAKAALNSNGNGAIVKDVSKRTHAFLLKGLVYCEHCGTAMTPAWSFPRRQIRHHYYRCMSVLKMDRTACEVRNVPAEALEEYVVSRLDLLSRNKDIIKKIVDRTQKLTGEEFPLKQDEKKKASAELGKIELKIRNLVNVLADEGAQSPSRSFISQQLSELDVKRSELNANLQQLEEDLRKLETKKIDADLVHRNLGNYMQVFKRLSESEKAEIMGLLIHQVAYDGKNSKMKIALRPLPEVWGDMEVLESAFKLEEGRFVVHPQVLDGQGDLFANRKRTLPELYAKQMERPQNEQNYSLIYPKMPQNPVFILWDRSKFDTVRTAKGKIGTIVSFLAEAIKRRQRRYRQSPEPRPPTIQILLKKAYGLKRRLEEDPKLTRAALAKEEGIDASFLSRILNLLKLAPEIQSHILKMPPSNIQSPISERKLQHLARNLNRTRQLDEFNRIKALTGRAKIPSPTRTNHFFLRINPANFPVDLGYQLLPAVKDLN
ncbi:MAG: recombinase zinc beta ribbon domain-containing protein [Elusimicrobia bacterium]|nr:recombinase zinc beta ribbon domain-containing protein [Candidatus Obscuribacterium magneticum]